MKKLLFFFLLFGYFYQTKAQEISFTPNTSHYKIITKLFEGRWDSLKQECVWKPNLAEKYDFEELNADSLYTHLVDIFHYHIKDDLYILFVTSTYSKDNGEYPTFVYSPAMSIILLKHDNDKAKIEVKIFKKYASYFGSRGFTPTNITLVEIGNDVYCVKVIDYGDVTRQYTEEFTTLYYQGNKILRFISHDIYDYYEYTTTMTIDKASKKIILHKKGTEAMFNASDNEPKIVPVDEIKTYKFNGNTFELVCGN
jgi:hypothetical protein